MEVIARVYRPPENQIAVQVLGSTRGPVERAVFALAAVVMAPLVEEILFRGILYPLLKHRGYPRLAFWGTSFLFAAIHVHLASFIPLFLFGLILIWIYERTDTLLAPILTHSTFNAIQLVSFFVIDRWFKPTS